MPTIQIRNKQSGRVVGWRRVGPTLSIVHKRQVITDLVLKCGLNRESLYVTEMSGSVCLDKYAVSDDIRSAQ